MTLGRGKTELRQLNLPPVPDNELPEMVRLQAMQSFVGISENAAVDYLPMPSADSTTAVLAAVAAPAVIKSVQTVVNATGLELVSIGLRPVAAAAMYQINANKTQSVDDSSIIGDVVLLDLLADDAEIVVLRGRRVLFVRSVKLPPESVERPSQIAGELRRSLMACGINSSSTSQKIVIWGRSKTHEAERIKIAELLGCRVVTLDPMTLVDLDKRAQAAMSSSEHTGRFAPLVGLLLAAAQAPTTGSPYLVDFLSPRKAVEVKTNHQLYYLIGGIAAATVLAVVGVCWANLKAKDREIAAKEVELKSLKPEVEKAEAMIARTETVDRFLDGNVMWLDELSRTAKQIPGADELILKNVSVITPREGGGKLTLVGAAKSTDFVDQLSTSLRDDLHSVNGTGAKNLGTREAYQWGFTETVTIDASTVREQRYAKLAELRDREAAAEATANEAAATETVETQPLPAAEVIEEPVSVEATTDEAKSEAPKPEVPDEPSEVAPEETPVAATSETTAASTTETPVASPEVTPAAAPEKTGDTAE